MLKLLFSLIVFIHSLIHLIGFIKGFKPELVTQISSNISKISASFWLIAAIGFLVSLFLFIQGNNIWWSLAVLSLVISQILIISCWNDAKFGTILNAIVLIVAVFGYGQWQFDKKVEDEKEEFFAQIKADNKEQTVLTEEMTANLPDAVNKWLRKSNVFGKKISSSISLKQTGQMRTSTEGMWMKVEAEQLFKAYKPEFIWTADVSVINGIYIAGRDKLIEGNGNMLIKLLSVFPIADSKGYEINQGTLLRYLAEIVWFPTTAVSDFINWEEVDSLSAKATLTHNNISVSGIFRFNAAGDVVSFEAKRYYEKDGKSTLEDWLVTNSADGYKEFSGIRIPSKSAVTWKLKSGNFTWFTLEIKDIIYN